MTIACQSVTLRPGETSVTPVLLVGCDGVDWNIAVPLIKMGTIPTIERLSRRGVMSNLFSPTMASPVEWTSIVTGKTAEKHGITTWAKPVRDARKEFQVLTRKNRTARTLWNILSDQGMMVNIVGWWVTWPTEIVNGILLTDAFLYRDKLQQTVYPAEFEVACNELEREGDALFRDHIEAMGLPAVELLNAQHQPFSRDVRFASGQINTFYHQLRFDFIKHIITRSLIRQGPAPFTAVYYRGSDLASHFFYHDLMGPDGATEWASEERGRKQRFDTIVPDMYHLYDRMIGDLLDNYTHREPLVIIVSDHGFGLGAWYRRFKLKPFLKNSGLMCRGKPIMQAVTSIETIEADNRTFTLTIVDTECELSSAAVITAREIEGLLSALKTDEGNALFSSVTVQENIDSASATLVLEINEQLSLTELLVLPNSHNIPLYKLFSFSKFSGAHRPHGIALFHGNAFSTMRGITPNPKTLDICPIILRLFGLPRGSDMDGHAPEIIFTHEFRIQNVQPPERASWESEQAEQEEIPDIDADTNRKIVEELKSIGYL